MNKMTTTAYRIEDLPPPPQDRKGWPWTEGSKVVDSTEELPRISVVTPSYNQAAYLEETIRSVLLQGYPNLEYLIIDGGSNDGSVEIIKKYADFIRYWVSEKDGGQSDALNKGFRRATGELIGWQNSDDCYALGAFAAAINALQSYPNGDIFYGPTNHIDAQSKILDAYPVSSFDVLKMLPYLNMCNQAMFFRKRIFTDGQFIDDSFRHAMDQEFFLRLAIEKYRFHFVPDMQGCYRLHNAAKMFYQPEVCVRDCLKIYAKLYKDVRSSPELKRQALLSYRGMCEDQFGKSRMELFDESYKGLLSLAGLKGLTPRLVVRYLFLKLGPSYVNSAKRIKRTFKKETMAQP